MHTSLLYMTENATSGLNWSLMTFRTRLTSTDFREHSLPRACFRCPSSDHEDNIHPARGCIQGLQRIQTEPFQRTWSGPKGPHTLPGKRTLTTPALWDHLCCEMGVVTAAIHAFLHTSLARTYQKQNCLVGSSSCSVSNDTALLCSNLHFLSFFHPLLNA